MAKFTAIGVGEGDSFYLDTGTKTILVDGGKAEKGFPSQFRTSIDKEEVDILVCTHCDADHANGIFGFLQAGLTCKEVWLPGT